MAPADPSTPDPSNPNPSNPNPSNPDPSNPDPNPDVSNPDPGDAAGRDESSVAAVLPAWERARLMRAVRRRLDLSQRELAAQIGVSPSTIANAELPDAAVSLAVIEKILELGRMRILVIDEDGRQVDPEHVDVPRDAAGRRLPAHLDAEVAENLAPVDPRRCRSVGPRRRRVTYHHRRNRDCRRERTGFVPMRHPNSEEVDWFTLPPSNRISRVRAFFARRGHLPPTFAGLLEHAREPDAVLPFWIPQLWAPGRPVPYWVGDLRPVQDRPDCSHLFEPLTDPVSCSLATDIAAQRPAPTSGPRRLMTMDEVEEWLETARACSVNDWELNGGWDLGGDWPLEA